MPVPLTRPCPNCQGEMELITADDVGEILIYECPDCGRQEETRVAIEDDEDDDPRVLSRSGPAEDVDPEDDRLEPDQDE